MELCWKFMTLMVILPIACEAITEIIGSQTLFEPVRNWVIGKKILVISDLLNCKYCLSVWVSVFAVAGYYVACGFTDIGVAESCFFVMLVFFVHRLANMCHFIFDIVGQYKDFRWAQPLE